MCRGVAPLSRSNHLFTACLSRPYACSRRFGVELRAMAAHPFDLNLEPPVLDLNTPAIDWDGPAHEIVELDIMAREDGDGGNLQYHEPDAGACLCLLPALTWFSFCRRTCTRTRRWSGFRGRR